MVDYYNLNNNGFGALYRFPVRTAGWDTEPSGAPFPNLNPPIDQDHRRRPLPLPVPACPTPPSACTQHHPFHPRRGPGGSRRRLDGVTRVGKFTQPSGRPERRPAGGVDPGARQRSQPTHARLPYYDAGLYLMPDRQPRSTSPDDLACCSRTIPAYNEAWPRALVLPYECRSMESPEPAELPWLPNDGTPPCRAPGRARPTVSSAPAVLLQAGELPRPRGPAGRTTSTAWTPSTPRRTASLFELGRPGSRRRQVRRLATSGPCACVVRWSPTPIAATDPQQWSATTTTSPTNGTAFSARFRCGNSTTSGQPDPRSGRQPGHQLPGQAAGGYALSPSRPWIATRSGAEHGSDLAPGPSRRGAY